MNHIQSNLRIVHVGDLHFWAIPGLADRLLSKRLLGTGNLLLRRARKFERTRGPELAARLAAVRPGWALFSGDFTTTSLEKEFLTAKKIFRPLVTELNGHVRAVPGNHDRYTPRDFRTRVFERYLEAMMPEDNRVYGLSMGGGNFLLGLDCTAENGLGSWGRVTSEMLEVVERIWQAYAREVRRLWILSHFPAEDPPGLVKGGRRDQLRGASELLKVLSRVGVPIFWLHGHHHRRWAYRSPQIPGLMYLNAGAPLMRFGGKPADLGFLDIEASADETNIGNEGVAVSVQRMSPEGWISERVVLPSKPGEVVTWQG